MDTIWIVKTSEPRPLDPVPKLGDNKHKEDYAGVVELADTLDSKSSEAYPSCGFKSHLRHHDSLLVARISQTKPRTSQEERGI